jgi:succinyl-CoA synthetase beta subunit
LDLFEFEAKKEFAKHCIPIPNGKLVTSYSQITKAIADLKPPYMVKAQVLSGGRGKAGGIIPSESVKEAEDVVSKLLGAQILGLRVKQVLVEEKISSNREMYVGITIDRFNRCYVVLASKTGGVDIEEVADKTPQAIFRTQIDSTLGISSFDSAVIAKQLGYSGNLQTELSAIIQKLYRILNDNDAELVEINPLAETQTGFVALDARMVIDDNAMFRHPEYVQREAQELSPQEVCALQHNLAYVKLDGDIGVIGNGAGLVMATIDLLNLFGGKPADFLDLGGGAAIEAITAALQIIFSNPNIAVVLINVLGGITHCDDVARGIVEAVNLAEDKKPLVVRLVGTNQKEGRRILEESGISVLDSMEEAARKAVEIAKGDRQKWA